MENLLPVGAKVKVHDLSGNLVEGTVVGGGFYGGYSQNESAAFVYLVETLTPTKEFFEFFGFFGFRVDVYGPSAVTKL